MDVPLVSNKELTENVNMNQQKEVPEFLGGLGDLLPADVLKKLNELLEQLHQKEKDHQGGTVINIYGKGSLHVDHVDNQYLYGDKWVKALQNKVVADRDNFHGELRKVIESWRPYLIDDDANVDAMKMHSFHFDFSKVIATSIYIDLGRLLHTHALKDDNMSSLAQYLYRHSNLSNSQSTLYAQLRKYKKR